VSALQLSIGLCFCSDATNVTSFSWLVLDGSCDTDLANTAGLLLYSASTATSVGWMEL